MSRKLPGLRRTAIDRSTAHNVCSIGIEECVIIDARELRGFSGRRCGASVFAAEEWVYIFSVLARNLADENFMLKRIFLFTGRWRGTYFFGGSGKVCRCEGNLL